MKLTNKLESICTYPFHMPGHKRNAEFGIPCSEIDITEINSFDNLHDAKDVLKDLQEDIARTFSHKKSIISVNGSTCCILAAIGAVCNDGDTIIIARNCHKSVYNACYINRLKIIYIEPEYNKTFGCWGKVTQNQVNKAIADAKNAKAVVITSPTYEGFVSQINCNIPLIIDAAHGSHFGFADFLPNQPNADIVIESLHKTLPALTQTAIIHIDNDKLYGNVKKYMDIYETSSPSYVLMSSIDRCIDFLKNSEIAFAELKNNLDYFFKNSKNIRLLKNDDITRIVFSIDGYSGEEIANLLRQNKIEVEGTSVKYVILISTVCDTSEGFELLLSAVNSIKPRDTNDIKLLKPSIPLKACDSFEIINTVETDIENCNGKISGEYIYAYPPSSPIVVPGEIITQNIINYIKQNINNNVNIISDSDLLPNKILTKND